MRTPMAGFVRHAAFETGLGAGALLLLALTAMVHPVVSVVLAAALLLTGLLVEHLRKR